MIKVINDWYIEVDTAKGCTNYTVRRGQQKTDKKGCNIDPILAFCGTPGKAINFIREQIIAEELKDASLTLSEACTVVKNVTAEFEQTLSERGLT